MNDRNLYSASIALQALVAITGAVLAVIGLAEFGLFLIGISIAFSPVTGHLRMRRSLQALKRSGGLSAALASSGDDVSLLAAKLDELDQVTRTIQTKLDQSVKKSQTENETHSLRREIRALRLKMAQNNVEPEKK